MLPGISYSHPCLRSLEAHHSFGAAFNLSKAGGDWLLDMLSLALAASVMRCFWGQLMAADLAFLGASTGASLAGTAWRRLRPASYAAWREWLSLALRVSLAAAPTTWHICHLALDRWAPFAAAARTWSAAAAYLLVLLLASFAAPGNVLALARPIRLCLHLPAQAALVAVAAAHNGAQCRTSALKHPAAAAATARVHRWLSAYTALLSMAQGVDGSQPRQTPFSPDPERQCMAVLLWGELLLGMVLPTVVLAAAESRLFLEFHRVQRQLARRRIHGGVAPHTAPAGTAASPPAALTPLPAPAASAPEAMFVPREPILLAGAFQHATAWRIRLWSSLQPGDIALAGMYETLHRLLNDSADSWLKWLLAALLAAACWNVATAL